MAKHFYLATPGLAGITPTGLVKKTRTCVTMATGNPDFPSITPTPAELTGKCDTLDAAIREYDFTRSLLVKSVRDAAFVDLRDMMHDYAASVQALSGGEREKIESMGIAVRRAPHPLGPLAAPGNLRAKVSPYPQTVDLLWGGVAGRGSYSVYGTTTPDVESSWVLLGNTTKNRFRAEGLKSDVPYYFRVVALGAAGNSPASDVAKAKAA